MRGLVLLLGVVATANAGQLSMVKKHSRSSCQLNRSFGLKGDGFTMWVNRGCRADFVCNGKKLHCASHSYRYATCTCPKPFVATPRHVTMLKRHSGSACTYGRSFGMKNDKTMWVHRGCRADFRCNGKTLHCASRGYRYATCGCPDLGPRVVSLVRKHSSSSCTYGHSYGTVPKTNTMWVHHGCRGDFKCVDGTLHCASHGYKFAKCQCCKKDKCGKCNGDNSSCKDCKGVIWGKAKKDSCAVCDGGDKPSCKDAKHCAVDGCRRANKVVGPAFLKNSNKRVVRCCRLNGKAPKKACSSKTFTFAQAVRHCASVGERLCKWQEIEVTCGTGCGHDGRQVWVSNAKAPCGPTPAPTPVPTPMPTSADAKHCAMDGCHRSGTKKPSAVLKNSHKRVVRCCRLNGKAPKKACSSKTFTFDQAVHHCKSVGERLCTFQEMKAGVTCGTGCGHDSRQVWVSSTVCSPPTPAPTSACADQDQNAQMCAKKIAKDANLCKDAKGYWFHQCRGSCNLHAGAPCLQTNFKCADKLGHNRCARRLANEPAMCSVASPMWWRARCRGTCDATGSLPCQAALSCPNGQKTDLQCQHKIHQDKSICTRRYYHGSLELNWWGKQCRGTCDRLGLAACP